MADLARHRRTLQQRLRLLIADHIAHGVAPRITVSSRCARLGRALSFPHAAFARCMRPERRAGTISYVVYAVAWVSRPMLHFSYMIETLYEGESSSFENQDA